MGVFALSLGVVGVALMVSGVLMLIRNEAVYSVRSRLIWTAWEDYQRLPEYEEMLYAPRHWKRWTAAHWDQWLRQQA